MIKLFNNSKIPNSIWKDICKFAMKQLKLKGDIAVLITKGYKGGGLYQPCFKCKDRRFGHYRWIKTDLGKIIINPYLHHTQFISSAKSNIQTILHEFKHAKDFHNGVVFDYNKPYRQRSQEINAYCYSRYEVDIPDDLILNLAIEIEKLGKKQ